MIVLVQWVHTYCSNRIIYWHDLCVTIDGVWIGELASCEILRAHIQQELGLHLPDV
jgi:hypothetical protein